MQRDHLSDSEWAAYLARTLSASEVLAASDHLAACSVCAARREGEIPPPQPSAARVEAEFQAASFEEIASWVDGTMTDPVDREIFEGKLALDSTLRAEVADLAAFRSAMTRLPAQSFTPVPAPSNIVPLPTPSPLRWTFPLATAAAVALAMLVWSAWQRTPPSPSALAVRETLQRGRLTVPPLPAALRTARGTLAGEIETSAFQTVRPLNRIVRDRRPRLSWTEARGAESYSVALMRVGDGTLLTQPDLPPGVREWRPAEPLVPGAIYEWQVSAVKGGAPFDQAPKPPEPEARFQVLDPAGEASLRAAEAAPDRSEASLGLAFAQVGLVEEADAHWRGAGPEGQRLRTLLTAAEKQAGFVP